MLQKIQHKKHELYAISRILHRLDDPEIELVTQQAVHMNDGLALLDLYLPQFGVALEVDEPHHLAPESKEADKAREQRVITIANLEFVRLGIGLAREWDECRNKVDAFVDDIRQRKQAAISGGTFTPFSFGARYDPEYWRAKDRLTVDDDAQMQVTHHVTRLFGYDHKGWQRATFRLADGRQLWMPHLAQEAAPKRDDWDNRLSKDGETIVEHRLGDWQTDPYEDVERVVFAKFRDPVFGNVYYRFLGVYRLASQTSGTATFTRTATEIELPGPPASVDRPHGELL